ncbi:hypothetical protein PG997_008608 [Apiospora hydei]|uniref:PIH1D1/2/3 CS-like domain-containing protein n=1 Tax=Apiospora hydei TaxID=1337664 RepID=A0ABR1WBB4_9PEZI
MTEKQCDSTTSSPPQPRIQPSAAQPSVAPKVYEHVLRKKYRSQVKLKASLDDMFGEGKWEVKVRVPNLRKADFDTTVDNIGNLQLRKERWIICLPKEMTKVSLQFALQPAHSR